MQEENDGWSLSNLKLSLYVVVRLLDLHNYLAAGSGLGSLFYVSTALFSGPVVRSAFVHMRTLCTHLCFCTFFEVHIFTAFRIFCRRILWGGLISTIRSCHPKICFPNESDYLMFVRWRKIERFLTPCLILRRVLLFS